MRKFCFFAATALILAGFGGWVASTSQARVATSVVGGPQINTMKMMNTAANLPVEHFADYSLVYYQWDVNGLSARIANPEDAMKEIVLSAAVAVVLLCTVVAPATVGFPAVHQEEIEHQQP